MALPTITLNGRAVAPLELRFAGDKPVANVRVAASERRKNKQTEEWEDGEKFFANVTLWEKDAEAAADAGIDKGTPVLVVGQVFTREFEHNGEKRTGLEIKNATIAKVPPRQAQQQQSNYGAPTQQPWGGSAADPWANSQQGSQEPPW